MFCKQCGKELRKGAAFCGNCGTRIQVESEKIQAVVQMPVVEAEVKAEDKVEITAEASVERREEDKERKEDSSGNYCGDFAPCNRKRMRMQLSF